MSSSFSSSSSFSLLPLRFVVDHATTTPTTIRRRTRRTSLLGSTSRVNVDDEGGNNNNNNHNSNNYDNPEDEEEFRVGSDDETTMIPYMGERDEPNKETASEASFTTSTCSDLDDDDDEQDRRRRRRELHELLQVEDPSWYQEYVLDMLPCSPQDSNYPAVLQYTTLLSNNDDNDDNKQASKDSNSDLKGEAETIGKGQEATQDTSLELPPTMESPTSTTTTTTTNVTTSPRATAPEIQDSGVPPTMTFTEDPTVESSSANVIILNKALVVPPLLDPLKTTTTTVKTMEEKLDDTNVTKLVVGDLESASTIAASLAADRVNNTIQTTTALPEVLSPVIITATETIPKEEFVQEEEEQQPQSNQTFLQESQMESMMQQNNKTTASKNSATPTPVESSNKVIVYRDSKEGWKMIDVQTLMELGYQEDELQQLLPDALAIIVQEQIRRPRTLGLPLPWRRGPDQTSSSVTVQVVANAEMAQGVLNDLVQAEEKERITTTTTTTTTATTARRTRRAVVPPSSKSTVGLTTGPPESIRDRATVPTDAQQNEPVLTSKETTANMVTTTPAADPKQDMTSQDIVGNGKAATPYQPNLTMRDLGSETKTVVKLDEERIVLYRDLATTLTFVPLTNLTRLGYQDGEIESMRAEAVTIIIADQITRPRQGIPLQWTIDDSKESREIQLLQSVERARLLVEEDKTARRRQQELEREVPPGRPQRSEEKDAGNGEESISSSRKDTSMRQRQQRGDKTEDPDVRKSTRENATQQPSRRFEKEEEDSSQVRQRRSRKRDLNTDGPSKRIYNAREILNRREKTPLSDPPDPNSPIWVDMDTFRSMLRNEAELRLRILGDDWASTVKQESEWRLDLYKRWLWTLHNGVGGSIVPPSRYERARTLQQRQMRNSSSESRRSQSQNEPPRKSRNHRPPGKRRQP